MEKLLGNKLWGPASLLDIEQISPFEFEFVGLPDGAVKNPLEEAIDFIVFYWDLLAAAAGDLCSLTTHG
ncbi:hypothetical protein PRNP1_004842 [Phytophthora ramorum]